MGNSSASTYPKPFEPFSWLKIQSSDVETILTEDTIVIDCLRVMASKVAEIFELSEAEKEITEVRLEKREYSDALYVHILQRDSDGELEQKIEKVQSEFLEYVLKIPASEEQISLLNKVYIH